MSVKKNFLFNSVLLVSQYIFPMLVFPYITRIFGASTLGLVSFVDGICDYFVLFSALGLTITGIRAIARANGNKEELSKTFSELFSIHLITTTLFLIFYTILIFTVPKMRISNELFLISIAKLFFNVFLVEWFYRGIENFKFITVRTILIKAIYVVLVFVFVKTKNDFTIYYILTCSVIVLNSIVNFLNTKGKVSIHFRNLNLKQHLPSFFNIGIYILVTSMYTTLNIGFLGFASNNTSVGYYSTSSKIFMIVLGFFSALNTVLIPRLSSLIVGDDQRTFLDLIHKSLNVVITFSFPIVFCGFMLAKSIIYIISGPGYDGAVLCFKLIIPLIFILGLAQIFANQILMTIKKDKELLKASIVGAICGITLNFILVPHYKEVGTSIVLLISEITVTAILYSYVIKFTEFRLPVKKILVNIVLSIPYIIISFITMAIFSKPIVVLAIAGSVSGLYFILSQLFILKNQLLLPYYNKLLAIKS
ncbi:O-antigen/teichoic acid export membrane protein [Mucilaginibacter yixingensis]|uniref:O-antigen/teichoic acid export membrane protein n=1 Tax=Mucilaginibacter yixingensis TaxID=1295612 RepID=A0A2T5JC41_9SPHI|nr:oligosaccharide flippase family protein [Mucilaginibacter yixingensis]PTQ99329.1 O-antigen/teichoic acid export membrane protein [Mucilaginibacter yixingensis]